MIVQEYVWNDVRGYGTLLHLRLHTATVPRHGIIRPSTGQMLLFVWMAKRPRHGAFATCIQEAFKYYENFGKILAVSTSTFRRMWHLASSCADAGKPFWREIWFLQCPTMWIPILVEQKDQRDSFRDIGFWCWPSCFSFSKCSPLWTLVDSLSRKLCAKQLEVSKVQYAVFDRVYCIYAFMITKI